MGACVVSLALPKARAGESKTHPKVLFSIDPDGSEAWNAQAREGSLLHLQRERRWWGGGRNGFAWCA
jgi:hypothetical protein